MNDIFTDEHREFINKQITKALKKIDFDEMVRDAVEREFEDLYEQCKLQQDIKDMVTEVIHEHLIKSGLLKCNGE